MSSRNREKRSRTPSVETNTSFVKNVTSRVSGLLPATLTKWFSSPSTSNANGSAPTAEPTDSSTDDEALEQPPSKRVRFSSNSFYATQDVNNAPTDTLEPSSPYGVVQSPPGRTAFRRETNFASTPLSALEPPEDRVEDTTMFKHHTVSSVGPSVAAKRKSLFDSEMDSDASIRACAKTSCNTMRNPNEPSFNASLLASPFYPGPTMYGGASACYINRANIKHRKKAVVNKSNISHTDNTISHSARRVMDLLEQYSSPLNDAKRISQYLGSPSSGSSMNSLNSSGQSNKLASYKTQELHVPSIASILRLKRRGRLMDTTAAARQIIASRSSTSDYHEFIPPSWKPADPVQPGSGAQSNLTSKVKSRLTRPTRRKSQDVEAEMPAPVTLPSAVLHIDRDNLPKFSFEAPPAPAASSATPATSTPSSVYTLTETSTKVTETKKVTKIIETPIRKPDAVPTINPYKFASPVRISSDLVNHDSTLPRFTFVSPERKIEARSSDSNTDSSVVGPKGSAVTDKDWKCAVCLVPNKAAADKCACCGGGAPQPAGEAPNPKKCSVCKLADSQATGDKCVNCAKMTTNNISKPLVSKDEPSKWKCGECWVSNEADAEKCVCCSAPNPKKPAKSAPTSDAGSDWKCDVCWIQNKGGVDKCAACGGAKPGAKAAKPNANTNFNFGIKSSCTGCIDFTLKPSQPDDRLYDIVKSQASKWECPNCLVRNEGEKTRCACCESDKPGSVKEPEKKFNFGVNTSFKFGIDTKHKETPKPVETKPAEEPKLNAVPAENKEEEQSETNNNVLAKTPMFSFGLPPKKAEDQADGAKKVEAKVDSAPKTNFSFGVPASAAAAPAAKPPVTEEKPQEVPTVSFTLPKPKEAPKTAPSFTFGATAQPAKPAEKPEVATVPVLAAKEVKDVPISTSAALPAPAQPAAEATSAAAAPTFTFGSLTPPANLFAPVAATSSAPVTFGAAPPAPVTAAAPMPLFQAPATTSSAPLSIFQKPEPANTTPSLFQKTEPVVTTAAAPAPLFSFGGNAQPAAAEKPKFNFTFGSNKTESAPMFGAPTDPITNKFTLPTGNALGSGTGLSNTSGGNGLTGNALGGTVLTGNTLGGSTLGTGTGLGASPMSNALGGNGMSSPITGGALGSSSLPSNPLGSSTPSSNLQTPSVGGGIFGAAMPKENNIWSSNSNSNLFVSNTTANTNSLQKPAAFTFGGATSTAAFGGASTPAFGGAQTVPNVFGMGSQPSNQASVFSPPAAGNVGGWGSAAAAPAPVVFGAPQAPVPTFDSPTPAPAFNFSAQQQPNRVFGFGQQPQQQQPTPGVYNFGGSPAAPQVQFNMGSAPNTAVRRMRKAVRKNTPR